MSIKRHAKPNSNSKTGIAFPFYFFETLKLETMKKSIGVIAVIFCSLCVNAQDEKKMTEEKQDSVYCLVMKDGLGVLTSSSGRIITNDINLSNGTRISSKGILTKKDGTQIIMKDGDCTNTIGSPMKQTEGK